MLSSAIIWTMIYTINHRTLKMYLLSWIELVCMCPWHAIMLRTRITPFGAQSLLSQNDLILQNSYITSRKVSSFMPNLLYKPWFNVKRNSKIVWSFRNIEVGSIQVVFNRHFGSLLCNLKPSVCVSYILCKNYPLLLNKTQKKRVLQNLFCCLQCMHRVQSNYAIPEPVFRTFFIGGLRTFSSLGEFPFMASIDSELLPQSSNFRFGNRKKPHGAISAKYST